MDQNRPRIGILEDDADFCAFLVQTVNEDPDLDLCFATSTVVHACDLFRALKPDLVLVDMQLPDGSGLPLIRLATQSGKLSLMLTVLADRATAMSAFEEGAHAYLLKDSRAEDIHAAIHATLKGHSPVSPPIAAHLLQLVRRVGLPISDRQEPTQREIEILNMIAKGLTYAEVAEVAGISANTVGTHIKSIYRKLDVRSRSEAVYEARQIGWLGRFD